MFQTRGWEVVRDNLKELEDNSLLSLRTASLEHVVFYQGNLNIIESLNEQLKDVLKYQESEQYTENMEIVNEFENNIPE